MTRLHVGSSSQSRSTSSRSANPWPAALLHSNSLHSSSAQQSSSPLYHSASPHHHSASPHHSASLPIGSPSPRSEHLSSGGEHSPVQGVHPEDQWHEAFMQPNNDPADTNESGNRGHLLQVEFNSVGQPIGDSKRYATKVGKIVRSVVSPHFPDWRLVPGDLKEEVWRSVKNEYDVPEYVKDKTIKMANKCWRNGKTPLRKKCDKVGTIAERKAKKPENQKKEDWNRFVELVSEEKDLVLRQRGKVAREAVKTLHTTGRDGIARRRNVLEQQSPTGFVSRSRVYLATHVYQELPEEQLEQLDPDSYEARCRKYITMIKTLLETEQYRDETHLDRDAVAKVFGKDTRGFVRGMGGGVTKTELLASAIPREQLRQEKLKTRGFEDRLRFLEEHFHNLGVGSNNANRQEMNGGTAPQPRVQAVVLRNMRKKPVAFGVLDMSAAPPSDEYYSVKISEVVLESEPLCEDDRTFKDVQKDDFVLWPQHSVCLWPV